MLRRVITGPGFRDGLLTPVSIALLIAASIAPDSTIIETLMERGGLQKELGYRETLGYYENLLDASRLMDRQPDLKLEADLRQPPPGWIPFCDTGLLERTSSYLLWRLKPNVDVRWNGRSFRTNSLGYRTPEIPLEKPAGVYRILVFGSSNTMGHGVGNRAPYPRLLERWLNGRVGERTRVQVVNLAFPGESPSRRLMRIHDEAESYQADWIICDVSPLDSALEEDHLDAIVRSSPTIPIPFDYVRQALHRAGVTAADSPDALRRKLRGEYEFLLAGAFAGWKTEADRLGVPLSLVILPRADQKRQSPVITELIRGLAQRHDLDFIDLSAAFDRLELKQFRISAWDRHPSARGQRALFSRLRSELLRRGTLPGLSLSVAKS